MRVWGDRGRKTHALRRVVAPSGECFWNMLVISSTFTRWRYATACAENLTITKLLLLLLSDYVYAIIQSDIRHVFSSATTSSSASAATFSSSPSTFLHLPISLASTIPLSAATHVRKNSVCKNRPTNTRRSIISTIFNWTIQISSFVVSLNEKFRTKTRDYAAWNSVRNVCNIDCLYRAMSSSMLHR